MQASMLGGQSYDTSIDLWAFGILSYEILSRSHTVLFKGQELHLPAYRKGAHLLSMKFVSASETSNHTASSP